MTGINNGVHEVLKEEYGLKELVLIRCVCHSLQLALYDSVPIIRNLPLPFMKAFKNNEGTVIIQNLTSVLNEEDQWKFPHEFNPENFLNDQEFVKPEAFMPFSAGPRMCLGDGLARMELFLIVVTLLRRFKFVWPEDAGQTDYTPVYGVTLSPKPYRMKVQLRDMQ